MTTVRPRPAPRRPPRRPRPAPRRPPPGPPRDDGTVTAETAVLLPALVLLLAVLLAAAAAGTTLLRYEEAARASARAAARGESTAVVRSAALRVAGEDAAVLVAQGSGTATVTVAGPAPGILGTWGGWELRAEATASTEGADRGSGG